MSIYSLMWKYIFFLVDITKYKNGKNNQERKINSELQIINLWLKSNKLSLNCKRSKFIVFYKPPSKTVIPEIVIDNEKNCCVDKFNFLWHTITKHLSWKKQHKNI